LTLARSTEPSSENVSVQGQLERLRQRGIHLTKEEFELTLALSELEKQGEYLLRLERPLSRKLDERTRLEIGSMIQADNSLEYDQIFARCGLPTDKAQGLKIHAGKIVQAAFEAESAITQVLYARSDYHAAVRAQLHEDAFDEYLAWERARPARRELGVILKQHLEETGEELPAVHQSNLLALLSEVAENSEFVTSHNLFDDLPAIRIGAIHALENAHRRSNAFRAI